MDDLKMADILLIEDNAGDITLTREALEESKVKNNLFVARDGEEAMEFLNKQGRYSDMPTPDLILLDLNLPKKDGREVLRDIKDDPVLKAIPVVVLTTSDADADILKAYELAANCYIKKPVDFERFIEVVKNIKHFWFTIVKLPNMK